MNHTYLIERGQQTSWQNECRLKLYRPCEEATGQAPLLLEPTRRPNMKGAIKSNKKSGKTDETELEWLIDELLPKRSQQPDKNTVSATTEGHTGH